MESLVFTTVFADTDRRTSRKRENVLPPWTRWETRVKAGSRLDFAASSCSNEISTAIWAPDLAPADHAMVFFCSGAEKRNCFRKFAKTTCRTLNEGTAIEDAASHIPQHGFLIFLDVHDALIGFQETHTRKMPQSQRRAARESPEIKQLTAKLKELRTPEAMQLEEDSPTHAALHARSHAGP